MEKFNPTNREEYIAQIIDTLREGQIESFRAFFLTMHPTDQTELFRDLNKKQRSTIYKYLSPAEFSVIFQELELDEQKLFVTELQQNYLIDTLSQMPYDDVADFLGMLPEPTKTSYLNQMDVEDAVEIKHLLKYPDQTAGAIMTTEYVSVSKTDTAGQVIDRLRIEAPDAETIYYIYVVDEQHRLVGVISLRDLIIAQTEQAIEEIMYTRVVFVEAHEDQEEVAKITKKYDFLALPVTAQGVLVGIVTVDDVMDVVEKETEEDFGEIAGARGSMDASLSSFQAAKRRAPWIILLMFLSLITSGVIGQFEETLKTYVLLAAFIPMILDSAGNTGTQALAVVVRRLAVGSVERSSFGRMLKREFGTGMMLGIICAITLFLIIPFLHPEESYWLPLIVGTSIFLTLSIATIVGATIPLLIHKLKFDPAIASGPFITTINDIIGLLIYFSIATALLHHLPQ